MRYLLLIYHNEQEYDAKPEAERQSDYSQYFAYTNELGGSAAGRGGEALLPTAAATSVRERNGKLTTTHGPFAETKEQLVGFYIVEVDDLDQAIEWAHKIPASRYGTIEIRPIMEFSQ